MGNRSDPIYLTTDLVLTDQQIEDLKRAWDNPMNRPNSIIVVPYEPPPTPLKFWELVPGVDT